MLKDIKISEVGVEVKLGEPEFRESTNMVVIPTYIKLKGSDEFTQMNSYYSITDYGKWYTI